MKNKLVFLVVLFSLVLTVNLVNAQDYVPGEILVGFDEDVTEDEAKELIESYGFSYESVFKGPNSWESPYLKAMLVFVPEGDEQEWIDAFSQEDIVEYAELNYIVTIGEGSENHVGIDPPGQEPGENSTDLRNFNWAFIVGGFILVAVILFFALRKKK